MKDVLHVFMVHGVGVNRNRVRTNLSEEFCLDVPVRVTLQQFDKTVVHRKRAMAVRIQYSDLGEFSIQGFSYFRVGGTKHGCKIISSYKAVALEMVFKKALGLFIG